MRVPFHPICERCFVFETSSGETWVHRTEKDGLNEYSIAEIAYWALTLQLLLAGLPQVLLANGVFRRSWSLHCKWKNPSRAHGWGEVE
jgi:hypothetical protein